MVQPQCLIWQSKMLSQIPQLEDVSDMLEAVEAQCPGREESMRTVWKSGAVVGVLWPILLPLGAAAQVELNVGTSSVQTVPSPLPNQINVLPPPPPHVLRQISRESDPSTTLDVPLSLMGEQILKAVCESQIAPERALSLMPDLSSAHIRQQCPEQLSSDASAPTTPVIGSSPTEPPPLPIE